MLKHTVMDDERRAGISCEDPWGTYKGEKVEGLLHLVPDNCKIFLFEESIVLETHAGPRLTYRSEDGCWSCVGASVGLCAYYPRVELIRFLRWAAPLGAMYGDFEAAIRLSHDWVRLVAALHAFGAIIRPAELEDGDRERYHQQLADGANDDPKEPK